MVKDANSPVVLHEQPVSEKEAVLKSISSMKVGDELLYTFFHDAPKVFGKEIESFRFACVEKGKLLVYSLTPKNMVLENANASKSLIDTESYERMDHLVNPENKEVVSTENIREIKINPGRFNDSEIEALKHGKSLDYNQVYERFPIPDAEKFLKYALERSHRENHRGISIWNKEFENPALTQEEIEECLRHKILAKTEEERVLWDAKYYNPALTEKGRDELRKEIHETRKAMVLTNKELHKGLGVLRQVADEVIHEGPIGQKMARVCHSIANGLARGNGLALSCEQAKKALPEEAAWIDLVQSHLQSRYKNIDKGLEELIPKRKQKYLSKEKLPVKKKAVNGMQAKSSSLMTER